MIEAFQRFITKQNWQLKEQKVLIALSGGMDSVLLCHLFKSANLSFGMAHCNFLLRGKSSDEDAAFAKELAKELDVPFFSTSFDTKTYAKENKESIQLAARNLRYNWLEKIRIENGFDFVATAHHLNDSIETLFLNFTKGCGIRGLHGIPFQNKKIIRPLSFATKKEIQNYVQKEKVAFREDASNASDKYHRNLIRHNVIPPLQQINPAFEKTASKNIERLKEVESLYFFAIQIIKQKITQQIQNDFYIDIVGLLSFEEQHSILYEILHPFAFNNVQVEQILELKKHLSGTQFFSKTHRLIIDRNKIIVSPIQQNKDESFIIEHFNQNIDTDNLKFNLKVLGYIPNTFSTNEKTVFLDLDQIKFPLLLRRWKDGDIFQPLGMKGKHQSLQDFFTHQKLSILEKEKVWILESQGEICWILGYRIDERFKIRASTENVICLFFQ